MEVLHDSWLSPEWAFQEELAEGYLTKPWKFQKTLSPHFLGQATKASQWEVELDPTFQWKEKDMWQFLIYHKYQGEKHETHLFLRDGSNMRKQKIK